MKPMLAATIKDVGLLRLPLMASAKLDGVRAIVIKGRVMSRSMKPIPNLAVQAKFGIPEYEGYDGELISGSATAKDVYRRTVSEVMTVNGGAADVRLMAFDNIYLPNRPYYERHGALARTLAHPQTVCRSVSDVLFFEAKTLEDGYEGVILRCLLATYKMGRSTLNEQGMLKLKRFADDEAIVVGMEELMHNANPNFTNELGYAAHTSHQQNLVPMMKLGALVVKWKEKIFKIGTGFSDIERHNIWCNGTKNFGRIVKFKYLEVGMKDLPRHPVFLGWRSEIDT